MDFHDEMVGRAHLDGVVNMPLPLVVFGIGEEESQEPGVSLKVPKRGGLAAAFVVFEALRAARGLLQVRCEKVLGVGL